MPSLLSRSGLKQRLFHTLDVANLSPDYFDQDSQEVGDEASSPKQSKQRAIEFALRELFNTGVYPGVAFCLRYQGELIFNRTLGYSRAPSDTLPQGIPLDIDTPICLFSASKAVTAILIHKLAEEGAVNLLHPVSRYIPEFGQLGKDKVSIYQMLAHQGGFPLIKQPDSVSEEMKREDILKAIYRTPSKSPEGRVQAYHAVTSGYIADELVRRTLGLSIQDYLEQTFSEPMEMKYFRYGLKEEYRQQAAHNYVTGFRSPKSLNSAMRYALGVSMENAVSLSNTDPFMETIIPAGNMYATAEEINRFYQMLLNQGIYKGKRLLQQETVSMATKEASKARLDRTLFLPIRFSPGFMLGGGLAGIYGKHTQNAFGHLGFSNIVCWADPDREISASLLTTGKPILGPHGIALYRFLQTISKSF